MNPEPVRRRPGPRPRDEAEPLNAEQKLALIALQDADTGSTEFRMALRKANAPTLLRPYRDFYHRFPMNHGRVRRVVEELARRAEAAERAGSVPVADLITQGEEVPH